MFKSRILHSAKDRLRYPQLLDHYTDLFPAERITRDGVLVHRDGLSMGFILSDIKPQDIRKTTSLVRKWAYDFLNKSPVEKIETSVYVKNIDEKKPPQVLLGVSLFIANKSGTERPQNMRLKFASFMRSIIPSVAETDSSEELVSESRSELLAMLNQSRIEASGCDLGTTISLARFFWTAESTKVDRDKVTADISSEVAHDMKVVSERLFWKEGDQVRAMFSLRGMDTLRISRRIIAQAASGETPPGTVVSVTTFTKKPSADDALLITTSRAFLYITTLPWTPEMDEAYGTISQHPVLEGLIRGMEKSLIQTTGSYQWTIHDFTWLEALYATFPGLTRVDLGIGSSYIDRVSYVDFTAPSPQQPPAQGE